MAPLVHSHTDDRGITATLPSPCRTVWKQDWLASIYELMVGPSEDVYTARNFHLDMAAGAVGAGLVMEYCMPVVRCEV